MSASKIWTVIWIILLIIRGVLPAATVYLSRLLVDNLVVIIGSGVTWERIQPVLDLPVLMAGLLLLMEFLGGLIEWVRIAQAELIEDHLSALVHEKAIAADMAFFDSPEYHNRLELASRDAKSRPLALLENGGSLLQNSITLLALATLLIPYGAWLPIALLASTLPAFYIVLRYNTRYHQWWKQRTRDRRQANYYDWILTSSVVAAELRVFDLGSFFQSAYQTLRQQLRSERLELTKRQTLAQLGAGAVAVLISGVALAWMIWQALQGSATLGDLTLFYQAFNQGRNLMRSLLSNLGRIYANSLFLGNLLEFLELQPQIVDPHSPTPVPSTLKSGIRFQRVTFYYPGSKRAALEDFNLAIPAGQMVAIVGANGAGKSTLVKLLCRLYDPENGRIEVDGTDIRDLSVEEYRRLVTVLFQFPVAYQLTASQNIALGDLKARPGADQIEAAARGAGAHEFISHLPQCYDTPLGKWFYDGVELSGGEWQRVSLARAFLRKAQIIILDEPTSFMDSWAEVAWLTRFRTLVKNRTALIITHRFTTAMQADMIHVIDNGQIVESGSHAMLLAQGGLYAQSWRAQMRVSSSLKDKFGEDGKLQNVVNLHD